ncbi:WW domain-containing, partial [Fusarium albosuccineum]
MSFFKKITKGLEELGIGDKDKDEKKDESQAPPPQSHDNTRAYGYHGEGGQGGPPPSQYYAAPPQPHYQPPSDKPPLPEGWTAQFDQQHQRWYYVEVATGRTQWEAPGQAPPPP